jgi:hypothetical protein
MKIKIFSKLNKDIFFITLAIVFFFLTSNAYAQSGAVDCAGAYKANIATNNIAQGAPEDENNVARSSSVSSTNAACGILTGIAPQTLVTYDEIQSSKSIPNEMKRGLYGMTMDGVSAMYDSQPLVNVYAHLAEEWIPGYQNDTSVYAAIKTTGYDDGYTELKNTGITELWTQIRNITYVFFIVIMLIVGFMIMFRSKIGGQTLVTLGNSLPNVVLALIGITFSFAIAGFIIDVGGVIMVLLIDLIKMASGYENIITLESIWSLFGAVIPEGIVSDITTSVTEVAGEIKSGDFMSLLNIAPQNLTLLVLLLNPSGVVLTSLITIILLIVILGVATVGIFKVFITLIKAYIGIIIGVVTGPIQIAMSAIPGKGNSFINWILSIFRNVLVYPITFAILNLPGILYSMSGEGGISLPGPDKLTLAQNTNQMNQSGDFISGVLVFILQIFVIFAASKADKYAQVLVPPTTSKAAGDASMAAKQALSQIPLIGSLIK